MGSAPLAGTRVVDFSVFLPGPFCTQILRDYGAEVIKVEPPGGDPGRQLGGDLFVAANRGKRSIMLDLKSAEGVAVAHALAASADVAVVGFRPGVVDRLGIGYDALRECNRSIIYCAISGFGATGDDRLRPGHDVTYMAASGALSIPGGWDHDRPVRPGVPVSDLAGSSSAAIAILAALHGRDRTGEGAYLDVSLVDAAYALTGPRVLPGSGADRAAEHLIPSNDLFRAADGRYIAVGAVEAHFWDRLRALCAEEVPELLESRFDTGSRRTNGDDLFAALQVAFSRRDAARWVADLSALDVPVELVATVDEAAQAATARGRGSASGTAIPALIEGTAPDDPGAAPDLDADRETVLAELARTEQVSRS